LPRQSTIRKLAEVLAVPAGDVEEFREATRQEACRNAPLEVLAQVEEMEVDLVDATVIRVAAQRSLKKVMEYLVEQGESEVVERIYREVRARPAREEARRNDDAGGA